MKLFEHSEFDQAVIRAAEHFRSRGLREAIIAKDYGVTEALRIIEQESGSKVIFKFKGGTSLSKGWNLIQRFSEDVDSFLDPSAYDPELGKNAIDRELKKLRAAIGRHPALTFVAKESQTIGGFGRNDRFEYRQRFAGTEDIRNRVSSAPTTGPGAKDNATAPSSSTWSAARRSIAYSTRGLAEAYSTGWVQPVAPGVCPSVKPPLTEFDPFGTIPLLLWQQPLGNEPWQRMGRHDQY